MATYQRARAATTHLDRHHERFTRGALEGAAAQAAREYVPVMVNHDIRYPPIGRSVGSELVVLADGEFALEHIWELWEEGDTLESLRGDGRRIPLRTNLEPDTFHVLVDRSYRDEQGRALVRELAELGSPHAGVAEEGKKSLEPLSTLTIVVGVFIVGKIAEGFLQKLGADLYDRLRAKLGQISVARSKANPALQCLLFVVETGQSRCEVIVYLENANTDTVDELFHGGLRRLDPLVAAVLATGEDVARIVCKWDAGEMVLRYAVRADGVPLTPRRSTTGEPILP